MNEVLPATAELSFISNAISLLAEDSIAARQNYLEEMLLTPEFDEIRAIDAVSSIMGRIACGLQSGFAKQNLKIKQLEISRELTRHEHGAPYRQLQYMNRVSRWPVTEQEIVYKQSESQVQGLLASLAGMAEADNIAAPFADYGYNSSEAWLYVPDSEIKTYLSERYFEHDTKKFIRTKRKPLLTVEAASNDSIAVPTHLLTHAAAFDSWQGRSDISKRYQSDYGVFTGNSLIAIKHYAALPTELPPVDTIRVFINSDAEIYADNGNDGSHRIGAAVLRGDASIKARKLQIALTDR